jgi:hypothetical protein
VGTRDDMMGKEVQASERREQGRKEEVMKER